jgi:site-specific DNA recombinase
MYCMYLRKSRADMEAEARGETETLARHEAMLWELAKKQGLHIGAVYREIGSGETIASRPVMQQLLSEVEQGRWEGVLVVEVERLARGDTMDQGLVAQTFKYSNTKIITPLKMYDPSNEFDEEYFEFGLFMSRREYKAINRRLQAGRIAAVKEGKYVANLPPYGYVKKKLEGQKGYTLEPHPEQAPVIRMIFEMYLAGDRAAAICSKLNAMKIPSAKGTFWVPPTVRDILSNPTYIGKIRWNSRPQRKKIVDGQVIMERPRANESTWIVVDGLHEPIIDEDTFYTVQKSARELPAVRAPGKRGVKNPLAGLIICGKCGRRMVRRPFSNSRQPAFLICSAAACTNVGSYLHLVEARLLEALQDWLSKYRITIAQEDAGTDEELLKQSLERIQKELAILDKQMSSLHDLLEQGVYSIETFLERSNLLEKRIAAAQADKKRIEDELEKAALREKSKEEIVPAVMEVLDLYWQLESPADRNHLLKKVLDKAVYDKDVAGRRNGKGADDFRLVIYPRLP